MGALQLLRHDQSSLRVRGPRTLVFGPNHQSTGDNWALLMVQNRGTERGQAPREGTMDILTGPPLTTVRITLVGSGFAILLQSTTINRAAGGRDTAPGVYSLVRMMQAMMNVISRGDGVADHQEAWTQGTE